MHPTDADIAILTDRRYEAPTDVDWYVGNILEEAQLLMDALSARGLRSVRVDWSRGDVDWSRFRAGVFRSTWDYFDRFDAFSAWLDRASRETVLFNSADLVRWNVDKHYLRDLSERGVRVVPSHFLERGEQRSLATVLAETGWEEVVVKPAVSGAARHTYRVDQSSVSEIEPLVARLLGEESLLVQPFQRDIVERGEVTLVVIGGRYTHALMKVAAAGDFRVQDDHGGTVHPYTPDAEEIAFAEAAIRACGERPAYGRVGLVRDNDGALAVMELELVEPELWFRLHPPAAEALAAELAERLG